MGNVSFAVAPGADEALKAKRKRPEGLLFALACVAMLFIAHLAYGALRSEAALTLTLMAALLVIAAVWSPATRPSLLRGMKGLWPPLTMFALVIAAALLSLTPFAPGGPHPVWTYVGRAGAATVDISSTLVQIIQLLGLGCLFLVGAVCGGSDGRARTTLALIVGAGVLFTLFALIGFASGTLFQTQKTRLEALFLNPNTAATLIGCLCVLATAMAFRASGGGSLREQWVKAAVPAAAALFFGICLLLTASRGGLVATSAAMAVLCLWRGLSGGRRLSWTLVATGGLLIVVGVLLYVFGDLVLVRFFRLAEGPDGRLLVYQTHWPAFLASPWTGYGLGSFDTVNRTLITRETFADLWNIRAALNVYLQWLEEAGIIGAVPMFLCIGLVMAMTLAGTIRRQRMTVWLQALLAVDLVFLIHGMSDFALQTPSMAAFWSFLLGLQFSLSKPSRGASGDRAGFERMEMAGAAGAAGVTAILAGLCMVALATGSAPATGPLRLQMAAGYDRKAETALTAGGREGAAVARAASRAALEQYPYDTAAWLRLAWIDRTDDGVLGPSGLAALKTSYDLIAYDQYVALWRIRFGLENWEVLSPELRRNVTNEAAAQVKGGRRRALVATLRSIRNHRGRLQAGFMLAQMHELHKN